LFQGFQNLCLWSHRRCWQEHHRKRLPHSRRRRVNAQRLGHAPLSRHQIDHDRVPHRHVTQSGDKLSDVGIRRQLALRRVAQRDAPRFEALLAPADDVLGSGCPRPVARPLRLAPAIGRPLRQAGRTMGTRRKGACNHFWRRGYHATRIGTAPRIHALRGPIPSIRDGPRVHHIDMLRERLSRSNDRAFTASGGLAAESHQDGPARPRPGKLRRRDPGQCPRAVHHGEVRRVGSQHGTHRTRGREAHHHDGVEGREAQHQGNGRDQLARVAQFQCHVDRVATGARTPPLSSRLLWGVRRTCAWGRHPP